MAEIVLDGVSKRFPDGFEAVKDLNLTVENVREFLTLVGPSGLWQVDHAADDLRAGTGRTGGDIYLSTASRSAGCRRTSGTSRWCSRTTPSTRT